MQGTRADQLAEGARGFERGSGALVARSFHAALALVYFTAFAQLADQLPVLIGSRGLAPAAAFLDTLSERADLSFFDLPTLFWLSARDGVLMGGTWLGMGLAGGALLGLQPRLCFALLVPLYLSYAVVSRSFLGFQWDNLLLECGFLAIFLPRDRPAAWIHFLLRFVLFKVYFESGIAKWQSQLGDWRDGSAMLAYYETAPLPTPLAWTLHHFPDWWHRLESWATLALESVWAFGLLGPRRVRFWVGLPLLGFQALNLATANYGFFIYTILALHLFCFADRDLARLGLGRIFSARAASDSEEAGPGEVRAPLWGRLRGAGAIGFSVWVIGSSLLDAAVRFGPPSDLAKVSRVIAYPGTHLRLVNSYHLFGHITPRRIEPEFQTYDGTHWIAHPLRYKPGPLDRAPPFVAPYQPRVDFQLWFYGLSFERGTPPWVETLLRRLCHDPEAVAPLFAGVLPARPEAVRIRFFDYRFSTPGNPGGHYWTRQRVSETRPIACGRGQR